MTLDELKRELENDLPIKLTSLQSEAANNPILYGKYNRLLADFARVDVKLNNDLKRISRERMMFYTGRSENDVCLDVFTPTELKTVIAGDEEILKTQQQIQNNEIRIELCKNAMDAIKQRGFSIRAIVDLRKLESGE